MNLNIDIQDRVTPKLRRSLEILANPRGLNQAMGAAVQTLTADYLRVLAASRHKTAERLGATPSGHLAQAAEKVSQASALSTDGNGATLTINHIGLIRAFRSVTIRPVSAKALAIPMHQMAYNRRPAQLWDSEKLFIAKGKIFKPQGKDAPPLLLYVLVRSVTQPQDRTLLPSDEAFAAAAHEGAKNFVRQLIQQATA